MKNAITTLRTALQQALDELNRINAAHSCVRPDVTYAAHKALADVFLAPIKDANEVEQRIVGRLVTDVLNAGFRISVNDGEEEVVTASTNAAAIYEALASTDGDVLWVAKDGCKRSFVSLIWGNGVDVISDYGVSLEDVLKGANDLAQELEA